ncbi:ABC transporter ATP-binding protein [Amycolatopsis cihanbeyliensis]|uniref:ABC-2 type transport system ATP-binding protein n=1 Tax=Amycolatopsis cihanbeyliensis TaxID=1128664 RepID=A0A542DBR3_AMYCI|nr:ATP-binding cassette domain-containing protein [Amycolatopsis cihanbeyliensis]TQJ00518.1 ABC-2 type transport system ATP-binding protein [Amycolatopsis cihanbeyliensis]
MIEVENLSKRYGSTLAVEGLTFTVRPGVVTGFLGPNGAGKSTTMRMILGLHAPTTGTVRVNGAAPDQHQAPLREIGALLEATATHHGRSAYHHLHALGASNGIGKRRVTQVLELVGLTDAAHRRAGGFSLGMAQRLGIAAALLGDPSTVLLDEPVNGLDPEGIIWIRDLLNRLADEGRTVFVSSHLMREMAEIADQVVVIGKGRLIADLPLADLIGAISGHRVSVRSPQVARLRRALFGPDVTVTTVSPVELEVEGLTAERIGDVAAAEGIPLHQLTTAQASLEEAFLELTHDAVEYRSPSLGRV